MKGQKGQRLLDKTLAIYWTQPLFLDENELYIQINKSQKAPKLRIVIISITRDAKAYIKNYH